MDETSRELLSKTAPGQRAETAEAVAPKGAVALASPGAAQSGAASPGAAQSVPAQPGAAPASEQVRRVNVYARAPQVRDAMLALNKAARGELDDGLVELVETRASQINHCAWCLNMHTADALEAGVDQRKLFLLNAWAEAGELYTEREQAALALTEAMTMLTDGFVPDEVYLRAEAQFTKVELAQLVSVISTINAFNRISVATRRMPRFT